MFSQALRPQGVEYPFLQRSSAFLMQCVHGYILNLTWLYSLYVSMWMKVMAKHFPEIRKRCRQHLESICISSANEF